MALSLTSRSRGSWLIVVVIAACGAAALAHTRTDGGQGAAGTGRANPTAGRDVFRFETFGNEGFWTDAARMPQGVLAAKLTPMQALEAGLLVDIDAVPAAMREALGRELKTCLLYTSPSPRDS